MQRQTVLVWLRDKPTEAAIEFAAKVRASLGQAYMREFRAWDGTVETCDAVYLDGDGMGAIAEAYGVPVLSNHADDVASDDSEVEALKPKRRRRKKPQEAEPE